MEGNVVGEQKIPSKYHQLVEKFNGQNLSSSCVMHLINFNYMDSVIRALI